MKNNFPRIIINFYQILLQLKELSFFGNEMLILNDLKSKQLREMK